MGAGIDPNSTWAQSIAPWLSRMSGNIAGSFNPNPTMDYASQFQWNAQTGRLEPKFGTTQQRPGDVSIGRGLPPSTESMMNMPQPPQLPQRPQLNQMQPFQAPQAPHSPMAAQWPGMGGQPGQGAPQGRPLAPPGSTPLQSAVRRPSAPAGPLAGPTGPFAGNPQGSVVGNAGPTPSQGLSPELLAMMQGPDQPLGPGRDAPQFGPMQGGANPQLPQQHGGIGALLRAILAPRQ